MHYFITGHTRQFQQLVKKYNLCPLYYHPCHVSTLQFFPASNMSNSLVAVFIVQVLLHFCFFISWVFSLGRAGYGDLELSPKEQRFFLFRRRIQYSFHAEVMTQTMYSTIMKSIGSVLLLNIHDKCLNTLFLNDTNRQICVLSIQEFTRYFYVESSNMVVITVFLFKTIPHFKKIIFKIFNRTDHSSSAVLATGVYPSLLWQKLLY